MWWFKKWNPPFEPNPTKKTKRHRTCDLFFFSYFAFIQYIFIVHSLVFVFNLVHSCKESKNYVEIKDLLLFVVHVVILS